MYFRKIEPRDNEALAALIRQVLLAHQVPKTNSTYADESLNNMYGFYEQPGCVYYVLEEAGGILGGGGIAPLQGGEETTCELQKMYFLPAARGRGLGSELLKLLLDEAVKLGYTGCYLETVPQMTAAQGLYRKYGFSQLQSPLGNTGHCACPVWMYKKLDS